MCVCVCVCVCVCKEDLALNNLQRMKCYKTKPNQTKVLYVTSEISDRLNLINKNILNFVRNNF